MDFTRINHGFSFDPLYRRVVYGLSIYLQRPGPADATTPDLFGAGERRTNQQTARAKDQAVVLTDSCVAPPFTY